MNKKSKISNSTHRKKIEPNVEYLNHHSRSLIYPNYLKNMYDEGHVVESFTILYANIERYLIFLWGNILIRYLKLEDKMTHSDIKFKHNWEFSHLARILNELGTISDKEYQYLRSFRNGRHDTVHVLPSVNNSKLKRRQLDSQFKQGLKVQKILKEKVNKTNTHIQNLTIKNFSEKFKELLPLYQEKLKQTEGIELDDPLLRLIDIET